jgi:integrase
MQRSMVEDFYLLAGKTGEVEIRQKKSDRSKTFTTRLVPMSSRLKAVMQAWLTGGHPDSPHTFCIAGVLKHSKKRGLTTGHVGGPNRPTSDKERRATVRERTDRPGPAPLSRKEAYDHFKRVLQGSRWGALPGYHVLQHSFASNCAAAGVPQATIDEWMGHQTKEMTQRYRHQHPERAQEEMLSVYG